MLKTIIFITIVFYVGNIMKNMFKIVFVYWLA